MVTARRFAWLASILRAKEIYPGSGVVDHIEVPGPVVVAGTLATTPLVVPRAGHAVFRQAVGDGVEDVETLSLGVLVAIERAAAMQHQHRREATRGGRHTEGPCQAFAGGIDEDFVFEHGCDVIFRAGPSPAPAR